MDDDPIVPTYPNVRTALRSAYLSEIAEVWGRTPEPEDFGARPPEDHNESLATFADVTTEQVLEYLDGSPSDSWADDLHQFDWIAQGVWTLRAVRRLLPEHLLWIVEARYIVALNPDDLPSAPRRQAEPQFWQESKLYQRQITRKRAAIHRVAEAVADVKTCGPPERSYTLDVVFWWAGLRDLVDAEQAAQLGRNVRTLRRWRYGRDPFTPGVESVLNEWLEDAHELLRGPMEASALVVREEPPVRYTVCMNSYKASA